MTAPERDPARKQRIIAGLRGRSLEQAFADPDLRKDMEGEAASSDPDKLVTPDLVAVGRAARRARQAGPGLSLFLSNADVIIVPGFLASQLTDDTGGNGLIWLDPKLAFAPDQLLALGLRKEIDQDSAPGVTVRPDGALPVIYAGLRAALEATRFHVEEFAFDWRKHIDGPAGQLADIIRDRANQRPRPLHIVAHSQGSLVARRALQMVGPDLGRQLVHSLVLLGPATAGSFSAAFGIAGNHELLDTLRQVGVTPPPGFKEVLQSFSGMYQLLPWRTEPANGTAKDDVLDWIAAHQEIKTPAFWRPSGVDEGRLGMFGMGAGIDASYLNDRTSIILGDQPTVGGVKWVPDPTPEDPGHLKLVPDIVTNDGDGTVPDALARVAGVTRVFKAPGAEHATLPATFSVIVAVHDLLRGRAPGLATFAAAAGTSAPLRLARPPSPEDFFGVRGGPAAGAAVAPATPTAAAPNPGPLRIADVSPPPTRRLRVFSFDPLFATELSNVGAEQLTATLPWEFADGDRLRPGPVGEYLEVVDFDASSQCFYPPVDLNHPYLLAQDGIPVSEGDPRFHQQMVYAVAMSTIREFEAALGRAALWAPNLRRDAFGNVVPSARAGGEYVGRLRVYPHAMREENAYYSPEKKALLFGYFPAGRADVGGNLPGGMVFTCLSHDVVAHETTHALLDGLHRYFTQPSNPDVFAFHEAFADIVALFQHFSHPEVLRHQIATTRGDLGRESSLGVLAAQFGEATGHRGGLRQYLAERVDGQWKPVAPKPDLLRTEKEPHRRGAVLVAAVFRAFTSIYENRVQDLRRIATGGTGVRAEGALPPDLVNRFADEAAAAARHVLRMCVRALDYVPPVDITFGEYLRALVTADYDLVRDDDRRYRVSVVSAFRDWGVYPSDVRSLSVDSLLWGPPAGDRPDRDAAAPGHGFLTGLHEFFRDHPVDRGSAATDRRDTYLRMSEYSALFHRWLADPDHLPPEQAWRLGLCLDPGTAPGGIRREEDGRPVFQVHMFRPCRRIGPDGQELTDVVVELVQRRQAFFAADRQAAADARTGKAWAAAAYAAADPDFYFRGGCTLVIDPKAGTVRFCVRKGVAGRAADDRLAAERAFRQAQLAGATAAYLDPPGDANPFAALHRGP